MSAIEELRRLLDERGVKYWDMKTRGIWFGINADGSDHSYEAYDQTNSLIEIAAFDLTPEQAIAATLGRGECHADETETIYASRYDSNGWTNYHIHIIECSECGRTYEHVWGAYEYCPHCGRKVVDE